MRPSRFALVFGFFSASLLTACGDGSGSSSHLPAPVPEPVTTSTSVASLGTGAPFSTTQQLQVTPVSQPSATPLAIQLPSAGGFLSTLQLPSATSNSANTLTVTISNQAPNSSIPALSIKALTQKTTSVSNSITGLLYTSLSFSNSITLSSSPTEKFTIPSSYIVAGTNYYLALYDPTASTLGWQYTYAGPGSVSNENISFSGNSSSFTFQGGLTYYFALVAIPQSAAQPTPNPSASLTSTPSATPTLTAQEAAASDAFVNSIGVNVHLHYTNTPYVTSWSQVESLLISSGIRHIRDGLIDTTWQPYYDHLNALGTAGIHADLITSVGQTSDLITSYPSRVTQSIESFEGPNEYDLSGNANWASQLVPFQQMLYATVHGTASLLQYPVIGPSLTSSSAYAAVGDLSSVMDYGNLHPYFAEYNPGTSGWGGTDQFGTYGSLAYNIATAQEASKTKPLMATETGYQDDGTVTGNIPSALKARYLLRTLLEGWNAGLSRVYIYELLDENNQTYGILDSNANPKPSYYDVKNFIAALTDPGTPFTPSPLQLGFSADPSVHHTLLEKRDGSYELILWEEVPALNPNTNYQLTVTPQPVSLSFAATPHVINAITFNDEGQPSSTSIDVTSTSNYTISITDHVSIITIKP